MTVQDWLGANNKFGIEIWENKYKHNDETFDQWLDRVSGGEPALKKLIEDQKFIFGGRILSNRGVTDAKTTLSNCYVVAPADDNIESIYECRSKLARTYSYGGGCGTDLSKLAPAGAKVRNQAKQTSGAVSFMEGFSQTTAEIGQNGRRGALMLSLSCDHPDLPEFIDAKTKDGAITKANLSVRISDKFMNAVQNNSPWKMSFTRQETGETIERIVPAKQLFHRLCENNWGWAEPGMLFWDRITSHTLLSTTKDFEFAGVNPCAEEPLPAGGSCLLGALNLAAFVSDKDFDFNEFKRAIQIAVGALNDVLDEGMPMHPLQEQRDSVARWRQIGLGVMGIADMLIKMEMQYDSLAAINFCDRVASVLINTAVDASASLAAKYGTYPGYTKDVMKSQFFLENIIEPGVREKVETYGLHNSQLLTIAPTGTISTMLGVSGGIEPIFANSYTRKTETLYGHEEKVKVYTPIVQRYVDEHNLASDEELPSWFVTAPTINPIKRIQMQAVWQSHIDASISSTINLPNSATVQDIEDLYMSAWAHGLKGVTVYRDGCSRSAVLSTDKHEKTEVQPQRIERGIIMSCSDNLVGKKRKLTTGCGALHVCAYFDQATGDLMEIYLNKGSTGGCQNYMIGLSRMISLACRAGVDIISIKDQLDSTGACPSYAVRSASRKDTSHGACCPMAIGNALVDMFNEMRSEISDDDMSSQSETHEPVNNSDLCPICGEPLIHSGGCIECPSCGWSRCS